MVLMVYGLKVVSDLSTKLSDSLTEVFFLDRVNAKSDLVVPEVIYSKSNQGVTIITSDYTDIPKRVIVYKWLEGKQLNDKETDALYYQVGQMMATLHKVTDGEEVPDELTPMKWDRVYYFTDEEIVYKDKAYRDKTSDETIAIMDKTIALLDNALSEYYKKPNVQLVHGDMNPYNVLLKDEEMWLLDFEDALLGYPIHDSAIMLYYYKYDDNFDYEKVKKTVLDGYSSVSGSQDFTDYDIDLFILARRVNFLNYIFLVTDKPEKYIARNIAS
ncbi:MAG: phosphotransferase, partial [Clostridiales bacterium]|nr:phosphotransferase [Clostridiales bacterium]